MRYIYKMEYYLPVKKLSVAKTWIQLKVNQYVKWHKQEKRQFWAYIQNSV